MWWERNGYFQQASDRIKFVLNESFCPDVDDWLDLGKTSRNETSWVVIERDKAWNDERLNLVHG